MLTQTTLALDANLAAESVLQPLPVPLAFLWLCPKLMAHANAQPRPISQCQPTESDIVLLVDPTVMSAQMPIPVPLAQPPMSSLPIKNVPVLPVTSLTQPPNNACPVLQDATNAPQPPFVPVALLLFSSNPMSASPLATMDSLLWVQFVKDAHQDV